MTIFLRCFCKIIDDYNFTKTTDKNLKKSFVYLWKISEKRYLKNNLDTWAFFITFLLNFGEKVSFMTNIFFLAMCLHFLLVKKTQINCTFVL